MSTFELQLFIREEISTKDKFFLLMHLLVQNQSMSLFESVLFCLIYQLQLISIFFAKEVKVLDIDEQVSDNILNYIYKIVRFKDLLFNDKSSYALAIIFITVYLLLFTFYFFYILRKTTMKSTFNNYFFLLNYMLKFNYFILTTIGIDFFSFLICLEGDNNRYIKNLKCNPFDNLLFFALSFFNAVYLFIFSLIMNIFYIESFYLSSSIISGMSCGIYNIQFFIIFIDSIMLSLINEFKHGIFFLANLCMSSYLFYSYLQKMIFYNYFFNNFIGFCFFIFLWESIFFFAFYYIKLSEKGLIFLLSLIFLYLIFYNIKKNFLDKLLKSTPYHKIANKYYLLYYLKIIIDLISSCEHDPESKNLLIGIMQLHVIECPNPECVTKTKKKLYLPLTNEWSDRTKPFILDSVFLRNFIVVIMSYFVSMNFFNPELIINLSNYYLCTVGNICMSIFYYKKAKEMNLNINEYFLLQRLRISISKYLIEKLKPKNEPCFLLEDLNPSLYYEYEFKTQKFIEEIFKDLDLCLEFWSYYSKKNQSESDINFNDVFKTVEKIQDSKKKVKTFWKELFSIYSGVNDLFLFYLDYIATINDDNITKRELESIQRKIENSADNIQLNYYNILFKSDTGIVLVNGDKGKEGIILKANNEFGKLFKYNYNKMRGMNVTELMPKLFKNDHYKFMRRYYEIGEKKFLDIKGRKIFALDIKNAMLLLEKNVKIFPILNHNIIYVALLQHEKIDDIIFLDSKFNIQGMSQKLFNKFKIINQNIFNENNIPFYAICKQFINFYKTFLRGNKKKINPSQITSLNITSSQILTDRESLEDYLLNEKEKEILEQDNNENIEINENIELEYEIKIPKFISDYSYYSYNKEKTIKIDFSDSSDENEKDENNQLLSNQKSGKKTVNFNLSKNKKIKKTVTNKYYETPGNTTNDTKTPDDNIQNNINENNIFEKKINEYKNLFILEKYSELENLMDEDTMNEECIEIKFNFTFKKYYYGDNLYAYIIRCIDNKNEIVSFDSEEEQNIQNAETGNKLLKQKIDSLKPLKEINYEEKDYFHIHILNFMKIAKQNEQLNKLYEEYLLDVKFISRVHGSQQNVIADDENASQTSASGYNSDLSKLSKIQEIKTNLMNNISNFFSLKYIRIIPGVFFVISILFVVIYLFLIFSFFQNLENVSDYNSYFFFLELRVIQIINNLIDLRTLFFIETFQLNFTISTFKTTDEEYFEYCQQKIIKWYEESSSIINKLERNFHKYLGKYKEKAWALIPLYYPYEIPFQDYEHYIILVTESLVNAYSIVQSPHFNLIYAEKIANGTISIDEFSKINYHEVLYTSFMSIEENYNVILPVIFWFVEDLFDNFINYIKGSTQDIKIFIFIYLFCTVFVFILYYFFIIFTNNHLGEGIEKVVKISQDKIDESIKQISNFKSFYKKKFSKFYFEQEEQKKKEEEILKTNLHLDNNNNDKNNQQKLKETPSISSSNDFSFDVKKHKKLKNFKELLYHYLITFSIIFVFCCAFFFIPPYLGNLTCGLIYSNSYLLQNFLYTSSSVLYIKCKIHKCNNITDLNYSYVLVDNLKNKLYETLPKFPLLNDFYYNAYLKDTCYGLYDKNTLEYNNCKNNDYYTKILNSTDATKIILLKSVEKLLYQLETSLIENPEYNSYNLLNSNEYSTILRVYDIYYMPIIDKMNSIVRQSFKTKTNQYKSILIILNIVFIILIFFNAFYVNIIFLPLLEKRIYISRSFIYIIPSSYISTTQVLENWLEKIDSKK